MPDCSLYGIIDRDIRGFGYRKPNPASPAGRHGPLACVNSFERIARGCLRSGIGIIQYRDKSQDIRGFYQNALGLKKIIADKALFIINDRADIARLVDSDGLHLGQDDLPIEAARRIIGRSKIIGKSCHSLKQAILAQEEGADYISIGPIFATPTKPDYPAVGLSLLESALEKIKIPITAIGGIDKTNIERVKDTGASIIAVVRAICQANDIPKAVKELQGNQKTEKLKT